MKTKEFIKEVTRMGFYANIEGDDIVVNTNTTRGEWFRINDYNMDSGSFFTITEGRCLAEIHLDLLKLIIKYMDTPLEERQEPKRFYLLLKASKTLEKNYYLNVYLCDIEKQKSVGSKTQTLQFQTIFTDSDVEKFKIDTSFFEKEYINE